MAETLKCYLCGDEIDWERKTDDFVSKETVLENYTYLLNKKEINICDLSKNIGVNCKAMLNEKYGRNPNKDKDPSQQTLAVLLEPQSVWYVNKKVSFFSSTKRQVIVGDLLKELTNNFDNFISEFSAGAEETADEYDKLSKHWKKVSIRIEKRWDDILTSIIESAGDRMTFNDLEKHFFHNVEKTASKIEKLNPTSEVDDTQEALGKLGEEFLDYDELMHSGRTKHDQDGVCSGNIKGMVDPIVCLWWRGVTDDKHLHKKSHIKFLNDKIHGEHSITYKPTDILKYNLENMVFDMDCKINKTSNGRYFLKK
tara:strand:+ start:510 stop:1442 length:933 start_codon:yes stop_codon:yes gene_type:complete